MARSVAVRASVHCFGLACEVSVHSFKSISLFINAEGLMNPAKLFIACALSLLLRAPAASGQRVVPAPTPRDEAARQANKELEAQALALLEEVVNETPSLKLPENRIRLQASAAELLWPRDKGRARELFSAAMNDLAGVMSSIACDGTQC